MFAPNGGDDVASLHAATSGLCDVVLLAGGAGASLMPITGGYAKPLVPLCNRPLIWFSVKSWLDAGARHLYICAPAAVLKTLEIELTACADFAGASFTFIKVAPTPTSDTMSTVSGASGNSNNEGGTADALRSYHKYKRALPPTDPKAAKRDVLVASCDTVFAGIDAWGFVRNFYEGFYSACAMYYAPCPESDTSSAPHDCLGVEPPVASSSEESMHMRVHFVCPQDDLDESQTLPAGAVARRANLTFTSAFADAHVYLLQQWVLEFLDFHRDIGSLQGDLFPMLAGRQMPQITREGINMPAKKIEAPNGIPIAAALRGPVAGKPYAASLAALNTMQQLNPPEWDELRTCVSVYRSTGAARVQRVNTVTAYKSFTVEVVTGLTKPETATAFAGMVMPHLQYESARTLATAQESSKAPVGAPRYCGMLSCPPASAKVSCCIIGKGVEVGEGATLRHCVLLPGSRVAKGVKLTGVLLCNNAEIDADADGIAIGQDSDRHDYD